MNKSVLLSYDLKYTTLHTIYISMKDNNINIIPGFHDGGIQIYHKVFATVIYSIAMETTILSWFEMRVQDRSFYDMHPIMQKTCG